jgi:hypothetical protein
MVIADEHRVSAARVVPSPEQHSFVPKKGKCCAPVFGSTTGFCGRCGAQTGIKQSLFGSTMPFRGANPVATTPDLGRAARRWSWILGQISAGLGPVGGVLGASVEATTSSLPPTTRPASQALVVTPLTGQSPGFCRPLCAFRTAVMSWLAGSKYVPGIGDDADDRPALMGQVERRSA